jgi:hypothetical protein
MEGVLHWTARDSYCVFRGDKLRRGPVLPGRCASRRDGFRGILLREKVRRGGARQGA